MIHWMRCHQHIAEPASPVHQVETDVGGQNPERHWEQRLRHEIVKRLGERASRAELRKMNIEAHTGVVGGREERKALHMVHMEMADEQIHIRHALTNQLETEFSDARARVKHHY